MNFFEHQAKARKASTRLLVLFGLAVAGIVLAVDLGVWLVLGGGAGAIVLASSVTLAVILGGSLYRIASLRGGGEPVALQLGGVRVPEDTRDPQLRRLRSVVEEIAIGSGIVVPQVYVLEHEAGINAFAAGYSASDAVVAVTRGALDRLNRDELQGVVAHEFSHVVNGEMRLNIRLVGVLFGILMISLAGRRILQFGNVGGHGRHAVPVLAGALSAMAAGALGLFFARMIKAKVSRSRESLADAAAVQSLRQTSGLAGALKKIGGLDAGSRIEDRSDAEELSHMLFGDGSGFSGWFAAHPPLVARIQALEPQFRAEHLGQLAQRWYAVPPDGLEEDRRMGLVAGEAGQLPSPSSRIDITPPMVSAQVGHPSADDYHRATAVLAAMSDELRTLARQRDTVMPLLLALLLDDDDAVLASQRVEIIARMGEPVAIAAQALCEQMRGRLHPMSRLPLASLAFPVLRMRPRPELDTFLDTIYAVVHADGRVSLFENCLGRLLRVQVRESLEPSRHGQFGRNKPGSVKRELATLLSVVAAAGHEDTASAQRAYLAGMQRVLPRDHLPYAPPAAGVLALDDVWAPLDALDSLAKQVMVEAITAAISHDGRIGVAEAELLRTICGVLHCPLPAMLGRG